MELIFKIEDSSVARVVIAILNGSQGLFYAIIYGCNPIVRKKFKQLFMRVFCCKGKDVMDEISDSPGSLLSSTINQSEILKENI